MMIRHSVILATASALSALACVSASHLDTTRAALCGDRPGLPVLTLVDSVVLAESDAEYLANPAAGFLVDTGGQLLIPDAGANRVRVYQADGSLERVIGRSGSGPGEFRGAGSVGLLDQDLFLWDDYAARAILVFNRWTGDYLGSVEYSGLMSWMTRDGDHYYFGLTSRGSGLAVARIAAPEFRKAAVDGVPLLLLATSVPLPEEYQRFPLLVAWDDSKVVASGDTMVVAFGGLTLLTRTVGTALADSIYVPACERNGTSRTVLERWFTRRPTTGAEAQAIHEQTTTTLSALLGLWRMTDGRYLIWYQDPSWESDGRILKGTAYLSLLSADLRRACVDARVASPGLGRPRIAFHHDTVFVLDQTIVEGTPPRAQSVVRRYTLNTDGCTWLSTDRLLE